MTDMAYLRQQKLYPREIMLGKLRQAEEKIKGLTGKELEEQKIILKTLYEIWNDCFAQHF